LSSGASEDRGERHVRLLHLLPVTFSAEVVPVKSRFFPNRAEDCRFLALDKWVLVQKPLLGGITMPSKNDFAPDDFLPCFLSERAGRPKQLPVVATELERTVKSSLAGMVTGALLGIAIAIGILTVWDRVIFAEVKTSLLEIPSSQIVFDQSKPATQSTSAPENLLQTTANEAQNARYEIAKAPEPTDQNQAETNQPSNDELFRQFQAWAREEEKRAKVEPVQVVIEARPKLEIMKPQQQVWRVRNVRAEVRSKKPRQAQHVRMQVRPVQNAPAQTQPVQSAAAPPSARSFSSRD
jgi:hypothetical protein